MSRSLSSRAPSSPLGSAAPGLGPQTRVSPPPTPGRQRRAPHLQHLANSDVFSACQLPFYKFHLLIYVLKMVISMFSKQGLFLNNMFYCRQFVLTAHTRRSDGPLDVSPARSRRAVSPSPVFSLGTTQDPPFQVVQIRILVKASPPSNGPLADAGDPARPDGGASGHGGGSPQMGQGSVGLPPHRGRGPGARVSRGRHLASARTPRGGSRGPGTCVNLVPAEQRHPGTAEVRPL